MTCVHVSTAFIRHSYTCVHANVLPSSTAASHHTPHTHSKPRPLEWYAHACIYTCAWTRTYIHSGCPTVPLLSRLYSDTFVPRIHLPPVGTQTLLLVQLAEGHQIQQEMLLPSRKRSKESCSAGCNLSQRLYLCIYLCTYVQSVTLRNATITLRSQLVCSMMVLVLQLLQYNSALPKIILKLESISIRAQ